MDMNIIKVFNYSGVFSFSCSLKCAILMHVLMETINNGIINNRNLDDQAVLF